MTPQPPNPPSNAALLRELARLDPDLRPSDMEHLSGGRTNHVWRLGPFVVKCHNPDRASPLFPNDPLAEAKALRLFSPLGLAPKLLAAGDCWLICDHIADHGSQTPADIAGLLWRLHRQMLPKDSFRALPNGSTGLLAHARSFAPDGLPPPPVDPHLPPVTPPRPVHADAVLGNILSGPSGPVLIDWQCPGMGDPAEDLATLLSPAMMWLYSGRNPGQDWAEALLSAYPDAATVQRTRALLPLYRWRIMAHCAWKAARGDQDYARALQIERDTP